MPSSPDLNGRMKKKATKPATRWKPKACGFCVPGSCPVETSRGLRLHFPAPGRPGDRLIIPREVWRQDFSRYALSVRLRNLLGVAGIGRLGDLDGRQLSQLLRLRNWGRVACLEVLGLVRHLQHGNWHEDSQGRSGSTETEFEI